MWRANSTGVSARERSARSLQNKDVSGAGILIRCQVAVGTCCMMFYVAMNLNRESWLKDINYMMSTNHF